MGAATHGLKTQRFVATVPIKVAMDAPCTVILVKQALPFAHLGETVHAKGASEATPPETDAEETRHSLFGDDLGPLG